MEHLNFTQKILINLIILWFKMMSMDQRNIFWGEKPLRPPPKSSKGPFQAKKGQKMDHLRFKPRILIIWVISWLKMMSIDQRNIFLGNNRNLSKTNKVCHSLDIRYCGVQLYLQFKSLLKAQMGITDRHLKMFADKHRTNFFEKQNLLYHQLFYIKIRIFVIELIVKQISNF